MKKTLLSLFAITTCLFTSAQQVVYFDPATVESNVNQGDTALVYTVVYNSTDDTVGITGIRWPARAP